jgi:hypothetical protein
VSVSIVTRSVICSPILVLSEDYGIPSRLDERIWPTTWPILFCIVAVQERVLAVIVERLELVQRSFRSPQRIRSFLDALTQQECQKGVLRASVTFVTSSHWVFENHMTIYSTYN